MVVREAGLLFRGFTLINGFYHQTSEDPIDKDLRSGLLTAMLNFAETLFSSELIEYFEGNKYVVAFTNSTIRAEDSIDSEPLIAYSILDKEKKVDKYINKIIIPLLKRVIEEFKLNHEGTNLSKISQFRDFKTNLDKIFGMQTKKIDERVKGIF
jgi:hypothetical protein